MLAGKTVAGTGHRPPRLGLDYGAAHNRLLTDFARKWLEEIKPAKIISGLALGWDSALAHAANQLKIPYIAALPFVGQENRWEKGLFIHNLWEEFTNELMAGLGNSPNENTPKDGSRV